METSTNSTSDHDDMLRPPAGSHFHGQTHGQHALRQMHFSSSSSWQDANGLQRLSSHHRKATTAIGTMFDMIEAENKRRITVWGPFHKFWIYTLPPQGQFHGIWDFVLLLLVIFSAIWEPYNVSFYFETPRYIWFEAVVDVFFYLDIVISFWTSYDTGYKLEKDKTKIAINYCKGWFVVDFISTMNWDVFVATNNDSDATRSILGLLKLVKMFRLFRVARLVERLTLTINTHSSFIEAAKFFLYVFLVAHFLGCFFFLVPFLSDDLEIGWRASRAEAYPEFKTDVGLQYITCLYWAFTTMTTIGYGDIGPGTHAEVVFVIFAEVIGLCFFAIFLKQINEVNDASNEKNLVKNKKKDDIITFIKQSAIDKDGKDSLMTKVRDYLRFKTKSNFHTFSHNDRRFDCLSYALRDEIRQHVFLPALERIKMFKDDEEKAALEALMEKLDTDEVKGFIDDAEFDKLCIDTNLNMSMDDIQAAMNEMGKDENGQVSAQAFKEWYHFLKYGVPQLSIPMQFTVLLASRLKAMAFSPDDVIVPQGKYGLTFFIVLSGSVHVHKRKYIDSPPNKKTRTLVKHIQNFKRVPPRGSIDTMSQAVRAAEAQAAVIKEEASRDSLRIAPELETLRHKDEPDTESVHYQPRKSREAFGELAPTKHLKKDHKVTPLLSRFAIAAAKEEELRETNQLVDADVVDESEQLDRQYQSGRGNHTVVIKSYHRYPVFGLPATLPPDMHQTMKDRCRRWEVTVEKPKVGKVKETSRPGCCDVAYIDRYEIMQIFRSMWDDGPAQMAHFVNHHYNFPLTDDVYDCLDGLNTEEYERRSRIKKLSDFLKVQSEDANRSLADEADLETVDDTLTQLTKTMLTSYQLTEERCCLLSGAISAVASRM